MYNLFYKLINEFKNLYIYNKKDIQSLYIFGFLKNYFRTAIELVKNRTTRKALFLLSFSSSFFFNTACCWIEKYVIRCTFNSLGQFLLLFLFFFFAYLFSVSFRRMFFKLTGNTLVQSYVITANKFIYFKDPGTIFAFFLFYFLIERNSYSIANYGVVLDLSILLLVASMFRMLYFMPSLLFNKIYTNQSIKEITKNNELSMLFFEEKVIGGVIKTGKTLISTLGKTSVDVASEASQKASQMSSSSITTVGSLLATGLGGLGFTWQVGSQAKSDLKTEKSAVSSLLKDIKREDLNEKGREEFDKLSNTDAQLSNEVHGQNPLSLGFEYMRNSAKNLYNHQNSPNPLLSDKLYIHKKNVESFCDSSSAHLFLPPAAQASFPKAASVMEEKFFSIFFTLFL